MTKRFGGRRAPEAPQLRLVARPDEILTRAPLLQALEQMDSGDPDVRGPRPSRWFWYVCPELKPVTTGVDITGQTWGRLTVVGLLNKKNRGKAAWVVRCACGMFEVRSAKAIREKKNPDEGCSRCDYVRHIKRRAVFDRTGRWPADHVA